MRYYTRTHHVHVRVDQAASQVGIGVHRGGVVAVLPECAASPFAPVVLLSGPSGDELHAAGDLAIATILNQHVDVIRRNDVVQHAQPETFSGLVQPVNPAPSIAGKLEQELALVAAVGQMPDVAGDEAAVGAGHDGSSLNQSIRPENGHSNAIHTGFRRADLLQFKRLGWSDPWCRVNGLHASSGPVRHRSQKLSRKASCMLDHVFCKDIYFGVIDYRGACPIKDQGFSILREIQPEHQLVCA